MSARLAETLYSEALVLADEMRAYFDVAGARERDALAPQARVQFACESLKATTRLMHVIGWLATRRAIAAGELAEAELPQADRELGEAAASDPAILAEMPVTARGLIASGIDLYDRVGRFSAGLGETEADSPARLLLQRLERAF